MQPMSFKFLFSAKRISSTTFVAAGLFPNRLLVNDPGLWLERSVYHFTGVRSAY